jgi:hypothetical protein
MLIAPLLSNRPTAARNKERTFNSFHPSNGNAPNN